jgi:hypothetical protein
MKKLSNIALLDIQEVPVIRRHAPNALGAGRLQISPNEGIKALWRMVAWPLDGPPDAPADERQASKAHFSPMKVQRREGPDPFGLLGLGGGGAAAWIIRATAKGQANEAGLWVSLQSDMTFAPFVLGGISVFGSLA